MSSFLRDETVKGEVEPTLPSNNNIYIERSCGTMDYVIGSRSIVLLNKVLLHTILKPQFRYMQVAKNVRHGIHFEVADVSRYEFVNAAPDIASTHLRSIHTCACSSSRAQLFAECIPSLEALPHPVFLGDAHFGQCH